MAPKSRGRAADDYDDEEYDGGRSGGGGRRGGREAASDNREAEASGWRAEEAEDGAEERCGQLMFRYATAGPQVGAEKCPLGSA